MSRENLKFSVSKYAQPYIPMHEAPPLTSSEEKAVIYLLKTKPEIFTRRSNPNGPFYLFCSDFGYTIRSKYTFPWSKQCIKKT